MKKVREVLKLKCTESTQDGEMPQKNASRVVSSLDVKLAYDKQTLGDSNPKVLVTTVHQICMTGFGCRANKETYEIKNEDIIIGPLHTTGFPEYLEDQIYIYLFTIRLQTKENQCSNLQQLHEDECTCGLSLRQRFLI